MMNFETYELIAISVIKGDNTVKSITIIQDSHFNIIEQPEDTINLFHLDESQLTYMKNQPWTVVIRDKHKVSSELTNHIPIPHVLKQFMNEHYSDAVQLIIISSVSSSVHELANMVHMMRLPKEPISTCKIKYRETAHISNPIPKPTIDILVQQSDFMAIKLEDDTYKVIKSIDMDSTTELIVTKPEFDNLIKSHKIPVVLDYRVLKLCQITFPMTEQTKFMEEIINDSENN